MHGYHLSKKNLLVKWDGVYSMEKINFTNLEA